MTGDRGFERSGWSPAYDVRPATPDDAGLPAVRLQHPNVSADDYVFKRTLVRPRDAAPWVAELAGGAYEFAGCFATPSPRHVLVVDDGDGFLVDVRDPARRIVVPECPLVGAVRVPERDILLVWGFYEMMAIGAAGLLWRASMIPYGDVELREITPDVVRCAWYGGSNPDGTDDGWLPFEIDTATGVATGDPRYWQDLVHGPTPWP